MIKQDNNQLFRLAAVLYADNNYEVSTKTIIRKVIECAILSNGNKPLNVHQIIEFVHTSYNLHLIEEEVISIVTHVKEEGFAVNTKQEETIVCLTERRKFHLESKVSNKTIDYFIDEFLKVKTELATGVNVKEVIYRFLYELLSTNIESFKKLLDSKKQVEDLINIESHSYTPIEREVINEFLTWDENDKNKSIFDIASYALEYCMISNNGNGAHIQLNNLKNKTFYVDTNVIYRALGINGENRKKRTTTFLNKVTKTGSALIVSKFTELELKDSITFYIDKLKKNPLNRPISPDVFNQKYFRSLSDIYDFYYQWRTGLANDSLELFEAHILGLYEKFKAEFKVTTDYKLPFDEKDDKVIAKITDLSNGISRHKDADNARHNWNGDYYDASNILLIETRREGKESNIFETKQFFISTDQSLRRWDYYRNMVTPIVVLPSQWLSILLRYINRTTDDYKSFVSFLNLPSGETQIDSEKIHIILKGISEMTTNFDQQRFLVQTIVQRKFEGILENGIKEEEILERTKDFAKTELQKQVEEIAEKHQNLQSELESHKESTSEQLLGLEQKATKQAKKLIEKEEENKKLKAKLRQEYIDGKLNDWRFVAYLCLPLILSIGVFFLFQLFYTDWEYNYVEKLIQFIDNNPSESKRNWMMAVNVALLGAIWVLIRLCWNRLCSKEKKEEQINSIIQNLPDEYK